MSLQGSLEAFPLPDVFGLLAAARKDGELRVQGRRVDGRVWVQEGAVVGAEAAESRSLVDAFFQLLRIEQGTFTRPPAIRPRTVLTMPTCLAYWQITSPSDGCTNRQAAAHTRYSPARAPRS